MCFYALAADFAAGAVAPALTLMQFQFVTRESISRLSQLVAVSVFSSSVFGGLMEKIEQSKCRANRPSFLHYRSPPCSSEPVTYYGSLWATSSAADRSSSSHWSSYS